MSFNNSNQWHGKNRPVLLSEFKTEILEYYKSQRSKSSYRVLNTAIGQLEAFAGVILLNAISPKVLDTFFSKLFQTAPKGVYVYYRTLKAAFNKAYAWGYIPSNPFNLVKLPRKPQTEMIVINRAELNQILSGTENQTLKSLFAFNYLTGLRLGEIVSLRWTEVDLLALKIQVGSDTFHTKNRKIRYVPLCKEAAEILQSFEPKQQKILSINSNNSELIGSVFCKPNGYPYTASYVSKQFKKSVIKAGVNPKIHFHSLRHGFATELARKGVPMSVLQRILGHSDIKTTAIYVNPDFEDLRQAMKVFDN